MSISDTMFDSSSFRGGQVLSLLISFSALLNKEISTLNVLSPPASRNSCIYLALCLLYYDSQHLPTMFNPKLTLPFFLIALCDVAGNITAVLAFTYGNISTVLILQSSTTLFVMLLSYMFYDREYTVTEKLGAFICFAGFSLTIFFDKSFEKSNEDGKHSSLITGDIFILCSCFLYAVSNIFQEHFLQDNGELDKEQQRRYFLFTLGTLVRQAQSATFLFYFLLYTSILSLYYILVSKFLGKNEASTMNLNLLTANLWGGL
eukprot:snap_masked-scaffold_27-processed-gene-1.24-mRNA-1 protein AED:1.00 eAED:1.00 QI:0/0/0/0/1/1/3/0/260